MPADPCPATCGPSVTAVAQGRKQVELGQKIFIYDPSRFHLTSVDLPFVSRVVEATDEVPCLVPLLELEMATIRELLSLAEIPVDSVPGGAAGMATGKTTPKSVYACCRLLAMLETPRHIPFLGDLTQRKISCRVLRGNAGARLRGSATVQITASALPMLLAGSGRTTRGR